MEDSIKEIMDLIREREQLTISTFLAEEDVLLQKMIDEACALFVSLKDVNSFKTALLAFVVQERKKGM